jgi:hypothetical protein
MNIKTLSAVAVVTAALTVPAFAHYHHVRYGLAHSAQRPFAQPTRGCRWASLSSTAMA